MKFRFRAGYLYRVCKEYASCRVLVRIGGQPGVMEGRYTPVKVGVLALQGAFAEHREMLESLGVEVVEVRLPADLGDLDGLILPGGESTTIGKLLVKYEMLDLLRGKIADGFPVFGTCAGMILLSCRTKDGMPGQPLLGVLNVVTIRNAFGRQVDSFESPVPIPALGKTPFPAIFIRAPIISEVLNNVSIIGRVEDRVVAVREGSILATSFHPELTGDSRMHRYFLRMIEEEKKKNG